MLIGYNQTFYWASQHPTLEKYDSIWLFSDEPNEALKLMSFELRGIIHVVQDFRDSPSKTLEIMRCGSGYVIGNSSFSWWAAFLSNSHTPTVIAPNTWFQGLPEPRMLIPENWIRSD
jgi:hypothetical protein